MKGSATQTAPAWFTHAAAIPEFEYEPLRPVDRTTLEFHDAVPGAEDPDGPGKLVWPVPRRSQWDYGWHSPARLAIEPFRTNEASGNLSTEEVAWAVSRALALPGTAVEYHFAFERAQHALWQRWREDPDVLRLVQAICFMDISLAVAVAGEVGEALGSERGSIGWGDETWATLPGVVARAADLHATEGRLELALSIARIGAALGTGSDLVDQIRTRLRRLGVELDEGGSA